MTQTLRIYLADDHAVVREGLKVLLNGQPDMEVVGEASDGLAAVEGATTSLPDVVIMDVSMPNKNGIEATSQLKQLAPNIKVVALTVHEDKTYLRQILAAGASGYVLKRAATSELINAIRAVANGGTYVDPAIASKLVGGISGMTDAQKFSQEAKLSEREEEVLRLIAQGYSNKEVAARLSVSVKSVETYKSRSLEKLGLKSRVDIIRFAIERGWLQGA